MHKSIFLKNKKYQWAFQQLALAGWLFAEPLTIQRPGWYSVVVANEHYDSAKDEILIRGGICELYFQSAFAANNDGKNGLFKIPNAYHVSS